MSTVTFTKFKKIVKFVCRMKSEHNINIPLFIWGYHGIGKTEGVRQCAEELNFDCSTLNLANQSPEELLGLYKIVGDVVKYYRPEWLMLDNPRPVIYFLDEILRGPDYVKQSIFNFVAEGRLHTHKLRDCDVVIAANNPNTEDYVFNPFEDAAFESRFAHLYLEPTTEEVINHFNESGCHNSVINVYKNDPDVVKVSIPSEHRVHVKPNNRMMKKVSLMLNHITETEFNDFGMQLIFAMVGAEIGATIIGDYKETLHFDDPEDILAGKSLKVNFMDVPKIGVTNTRLVQHLRDNYNLVNDKKKSLSDAQKKSLFNYMHNIPKDCATSFLKEIRLKIGSNMKLTPIVSKLFKGDIDFIMNLMECDK